MSTIVFYELVEKEFRFLEDKFKFTISDKGIKGIVRFVKYHSKDSDILVYLEGGLVGLLIIALKNDIPGLRAGMSREFEIRHIINYLAPDIKFNYNHDYNDIGEEISRIAEYFSKYCKSVIEGDFSIWPELNKRWCQPQ